MLKRNFKYDSERLTEEELSARMLPFIFKFQWFYGVGYMPHYFQILFHSLKGEKDTILRYRHLVAGRRGGKTLSAAWETLFYCLFPSEFHKDVHGVVDDESLHVWVLTSDFPGGLPAWRTMKSVIAKANVQARVLETTRTIEFPNGSLIEFKTAVDPDGLRGAGLDILWMDEAAFIPNDAAYNVVYPALSDKEGITYTTTTPSGKNWFYDRFWGDKVISHPKHGRVEYRSLDNPYFPHEEWLEVKENYHPMLFKQEYMAAFDALQGRELLGDWLKYYTLGDAQGEKLSIPRKEGSKELDLRFHIGVDPAISLADTADRFAIAVVGVTPDNSQAFLVDLFAGRIPFPEQVDKIQEWYIKWRTRGHGVQVISVESNAYQNALVQQLERQPGLAPIVPVFSKGKKHERILRMAPLFKIGRIRIREDQRDFIDEWLDYDSTVKNPKDDCLDAVEIAIASAALIPIPPSDPVQNLDMPSATFEEWARRDLPGKGLIKAGSYDEHMGIDW